MTIIFDIQIVLEKKIHIEVETKWSIYFQISFISIISKQDSLIRFTLAW